MSILLCGSMTYECLKIAMYVHVVSFQEFMVHTYMNCQILNGRVRTHTQAPIAEFSFEPDTKLRDQTVH